MRKACVVLVALSIVIGLGVGTASSARSGKTGGEGSFAIYVSPGCIVKSSPGNWVTIHTDVPFTSVEAVAAAVDGQAVDVASAFADDCGNLVAKLVFAGVTAIVEAPSAVVALTVTVQGEALTASQEVAVKD